MTRRPIHIVLLLLLTLLSFVERAVPCSDSCAEVEPCARMVGANDCDDRHGEDSGSGESCPTCYCACKPLAFLDHAIALEPPADAIVFAAPRVAHPAWMPPSPLDHIPLV
jgi:hypothetical protein